VLGWIESMLLALARHWDSWKILFAMQRNTVMKLWEMWGLLHMAGIGG